jgi:uncharacterized NAD(P)/FAD-binding protein YdhS
MSERIAIAGGGAAGVLAAVHRLREHRGRCPLEIELIDGTGEFGAGVATAPTTACRVSNWASSAASGSRPTGSSWRSARWRPGIRSRCRRS